MRNRRPIYFSPINDQDLINYVNQLEDKYKFSRIAKDLMRDGIRYRESNNVLQSNTSQKMTDLSNVKLQKKDLSKTDLESRLDSF